MRNIDVIVTGLHLRWHGVWQRPNHILSRLAARVPVVLSSQRADRRLIPRSYLKMLRLTDRLVSGIVVNSEAVRSERLDTEHVSPSIMKLSYNGFDTSAFHAEERGRVPALSTASVVIGVLCVLRPEKDLVTLIDTFARVAAQNPDLRLAIVGSGPELTRLEALAQEMCVSAQCLFQPAVSDVASWFRSIDIFVIPSVSDALS